MTCYEVDTWQMLRGFGDMASGDVEGGVMETIKIL